MKSTSYIIFSALLIITQKCYSQENDITFCINQIKENYPGLKDKTTERKFKLAVSKIQSLAKGKDEFWKMSKIVNLFNDHHLQVYKLNVKEDQDSVKMVSKALAIDQFLQQSKSKFKTYEGIWFNDYNNCVIAIRKTSDRPVIYKGYILESRNNLLPKGTPYCVFEHQ